MYTIVSPVHTALTAVPASLSSEYDNWKNETPLIGKSIKPVIFCIEFDAVDLVVQLFAVL